jgi:hypothetical protein
MGTECRKFSSRTAVLVWYKKFKETHVTFHLHGSRKIVYVVFLIAHSGYWKKVSQKCSAFRSLLMRNGTNWQNWVIIRKEEVNCTSHETLQSYNGRDFPNSLAWYLRLLMEIFECYCDLNTTSKLSWKSRHAKTCWYVLLRGFSIKILHTCFLLSNLMEVAILITLWIL